MSCCRNFALGAVIQTEQMSPRLGQDTGVNWRKQARLARQAVGEYQRHTGRMYLFPRRGVVGFPRNLCGPARPSGSLAEERRGKNQSFITFGISVELPSSLVDKSCHAYFADEKVGSERVVCPRSSRYLVRKPKLCLVQSVFKAHELSARTCCLTGRNCRNLPFKKLQQRDFRSEL